MSDSDLIRELMKMEKWIWQLQKKIDWKKRKENVVKLDILITKSGCHCGLILKCKIIKSFVINIKDSIGRLVKNKIGPVKFWICIIEF